MHNFAQESTLSQRQQGHSEPLKVLHDKLLHEQCTPEVSERPTGDELSSIQGSLPCLGAYGAVEQPRTVLCTTHAATETDAGTYTWVKVSCIKSGSNLTVQSSYARKLPGHR